jgi:hypothetical protein
VAERLMVRFHPARSFWRLAMYRLNNIRQNEKGEWKCDCPDCGKECDYTDLGVNGRFWSTKCSECGSYDRKPPDNTATKWMKKAQRDFDEKILDAVAIAMPQKSVKVFMRLVGQDVHYGSLSMMNNLDSVTFTVEMDQYDLHRLKRLMDSQPLVELKEAKLQD